MAEHAGSTASYFTAGHLGLISDPQSVTRVIQRPRRQPDSKQTLKGRNPS